MGQKGDASSWQEDLRAALRHLWDPDRLSQSPLVDLAVVRQRTARHGGDLPAPLDRAQALRQVLTEALEALRPLGSPQPRDRRWQRYRLLHDTYWQGQDNERVMRQLFLSRTTFYREQRRAIAALAQALADLSAPAAESAATTPAGSEAIPPMRDFVGRTGEVAHYDALLDARGWAVVEGAPGVGRTTLGAALAHQRTSRGVRVFWYTFRPDLNDDTASVVQALTLFLTPPDDTDTVSVDAPSLGPTVARLLSGLHGQAVLLCFDDVHVVDQDPALRSLLAALLQHAHERRLTMLVLSRHRPTFTNEPTGPALEGLSPADAEALLEHEGLPHLPPDLLDALYQRTQGNPQLLRLFAAGLDRDLPPTDLVASCRKAVAELARQRAVHAYLMDNVLRALSPQEHQVLLALTVCRPPVRYEIAEALLGQGIRTILYGLADRHILEETPDGTALTIHPLVCDFCYGLLDEATRTRLHRRAAEVYRNEDRVLEAAQHHVAAGEPIPAARLLVAHAEILLEAGQAGTLARQLAEFPPAPGADQLPLDDWAAVQVALGRAQTHQGDHDGALGTYDRLLTTLQPLDGPAVRRHRVSAYEGLGAVYEGRGDLDPALAFLQRGIEQVESLEDESETLARLLARAAGVIGRQGRYDQAVQYCQRSLALLPPEGQDDVVGEVYRVLGAIHHAQDDLVPAIAHAETALWASRRAGDVAGQIRAHQDLADYYAQRGDYAAGEHAMQAQVLRGRAKPT